MKPALPMVLGSGALADEMRRMIEADPDRYRAQTWGVDPVGHCPCCDEDVYRATTRHTAWEPGFSTHGDVVHPAFNAETRQPDPSGELVGCCCTPGEWGPKHGEQEKPKRKRKAKR